MPASANQKLNNQNKQANSVQQSANAKSNPAQGAAAQGAEAPKNRSSTNLTESLSHAFEGVKNKLNNQYQKASKAMNDSKKRRDRKKAHQEGERLYSEKNISGVNELMNNPEKL